MAQNSDEKKDKPAEPEPKVEEVKPPQVEALEHPADNPNFFNDFQHKSRSEKKFRLALIFIFAILISGLLYLLKPTIESYFNPKPSIEDYIPVSQEPTSMHLEINNPTDELLTFDKTINISGKTSPKSSIVISNGSLNWGIEASDEGEFSRLVDLKPGINELVIYAFDPLGNNKTDTRLVYMSEEKI